MTNAKGQEVYINGTFYPESEAKISIYDHGLLYGDGIFDTVIGWNGYIFRLKEHIDRLYASAHAIQLDIPLSKEEFTEKVIETCTRTGEKNLYIKFFVTRGVGEKPLMDPRNCTPTVIILAKPIPYLINPQQRENGITANVAATRRVPDQCVNSKIKNLNYMNFIMVKLEAIQANVDEMLMLNLDGHIVEGPGYNIFIVKDGKLITPPAGNILMGVTRAACMEMAKEKNMEVVEDKITPFDVYNADEAFIASTAKTIVPLKSVDGRTIGNGKPGPVYNMLSEMFEDWMNSGKDGTKFL